MKFLKLSIIGIAIGCFSSCTKQEETPKMTEQELNQALDSILSTKYKEIDSVFMKDFQLRKAILMKPIIDSLLERDTVIPTIKNPKNNEPI